MPCCSPSWLQVLDEIANVEALALAEATKADKKTRQTSRARPHVLSALEAEIAAAKTAASFERARAESLRSTLPGMVEHEGLNQRP